MPESLVFTGSITFVPGRPRGQVARRADIVEPCGDHADLRLFGALGSTERGVYAADGFSVPAFVCICPCRASLLAPVALPLLLALPPPSPLVSFLMRPALRVFAVRAASADQRGTQWRAHEHWKLIGSRVGLACGLSARGLVVHLGAWGENRACQISASRIRPDAQVTTGC